MPCEFVISWPAFDANAVSTIDSILDVMEIDDTLRIMDIPDAEEFDAAWRFLKEWARASGVELNMLPDDDNQIKAWRVR